MKRFVLICLVILFWTSSSSAQENPMIEMRERATAWKTIACPKAAHTPSCLESFETFISFIDLVERKRNMRDFLRYLADDPAYQQVAVYAHYDYERNLIRLWLSSIHLARLYPAKSETDP